MSIINYQEFCRDKYIEIYESEFNSLRNSFTLNRRSRKSEADQLQDCIDNAEIYAQKRAIRDTTIMAFKHFPKIAPAEIWKQIYSVHIGRKSGVTDPALIQQIISADNSWKKSSGHAFEEMIHLLANPELSDSGIAIYLQKDLKDLIQRNQIHNEVRDISWLKEQIRSNVFDLYITVSRDEKTYVYGCIQSKTSVRDRVTRDREPSINSMNAFFWSTAIVLDGSFLALPKFNHMVNGGSSEYEKNGWHGLYVFSDKYMDDRIYPLDITMKVFVKHAQAAAEFWLTQRQWFNHNWKA